MQSMPPIATQLPELPEMCIDNWQMSGRAPNVTAERPVRPPAAGFGVARGTIKTRKKPDCLKMPVN